MVESAQAEIERAARLIRQSKYVVAFTGAGSSTPSGIPDFRSPGSGLWEQASPMLVASIWSFRLDPRKFFNWVRPLATLVLTASPNPGHLALFALEQMGYLKAIITQNIDNLHQRAGSSHVLELHGHFREATCIRCYKVVDAAPMVERFVLDGKVPHCECGGVLKPNVILFGEQLPIQVYNEAVAEARRCDLMLVAGSSLEVTPAADIPSIAVGCGARAIVVNLRHTPFDGQADVVIQGDMAEVLPRILDIL
jgi:NAD-dependent deacetylase